MTAVSHALRGNLIIFAGVYVVAMLLYLAVSEALVRFANFELPGVTGLAVFYVAASYAGQRYASKSGWTWGRPDRHTLALWYSISAIALSFLIALPLMAIAPEVRALPLWAWLLVAVITPFYAWVQYGVARWAFGLIMKQMPKAGVAQ